MLKKAAHIVFTIYVILLISGFGIYRHYCSDNLVSISFFVASEDCCEGKCPFCENEIEFIKITDDFKHSLSNFFAPDIDYINLLSDIFNTTEVQNILDDSNFQFDFPWHVPSLGTKLAINQCYRN